MLVIRKKQTEQTSGATRTTAKSLTEFNGWSTLISATKIPLPDPAAVLDTLPTTIQRTMEPNSEHNLFYGEKYSTVEKRVYKINWFLCGESPHQKRRYGQTFKSKSVLIHSLSEFTIHSL